LQPLQRRSSPPVLQDLQTSMMSRGDAWFYEHVEQPTVQTIQKWSWSAVWSAERPSACMWETEHAPAVNIGAYEVCMQPPWAGGSIASRNSTGAEADIKLIGECCRVGV
jgi:hypothetical protein